MGWQLEGVVSHEGYVVAYVNRDWVPAPVKGCPIVGGWPVVVVPSRAGGFPLRELGSRVEDGESRIEGLTLVAAGCDCGWRSTRVQLAQAMAWSPARMERVEAVEAALHAAWVEHVEQGSAQRLAVDMALERGTGGERR